MSMEDIEKEDVEDAESRGRRGREKCLKAVNAAVSKVPGVTGNTAAKDAATFEVTGVFSPKEVFAELNKAGLTGNVGK